MNSVPALSLVRNGDVARHAPTKAELIGELRSCFASVVDAVDDAAKKDGVRFKDFELSLRDGMNAIARAAIAVFLAEAEDRVNGCGLVAGRRFRPAPKQARNLNTLFGVVRYWRVYLREVSSHDRRGYHPLDVELGLMSDRLSMNVLSTSARLATKMSFAEARATASLFMPQAPSTEVIEKTVLGFGHFAEDWFARKPAPENDGEVLVIQIDSKGAPTATEEELQRRRGKRSKEERAPSPRHRGRMRRRRLLRRPRLRKGDHSKNARYATLVVMYTLKRDGDRMLGPINRQLYASFAPKEHAFVVARREADKRGFTDCSGKLIQVVTDGDPDLTFYFQRHFPNAKHTIDVIHVVEKLWEAGESVFKEGTPEHRRWVHKQRNRLYDGKVHLILAELRGHLSSTPKTGPGNKGKRERLEKTIKYLDKRIDKMDYDKLVESDLEIATGQVEGAIKNVIGKRCDHGGMRWIRERAEAVVQLRCIELNGDWDAFSNHVHDVTQDYARQGGLRIRLQASEPRPVPVHPDAKWFQRRRAAKRAAAQRGLVL